VTGWARAAGTLPPMPTTELDPAAREVLRVLADLADRHTVVTVQAAAIGARLSYMDAYDLVNRLFAEGLLNHELKVTDAGRKAIA
jgi:hypothetical protein